MALFDIFNTTFFLFLAILLLFTALLVIYFESKMREQNHKIASMLSLVSSLAEEFNVINHNIKQEHMKGGSDIPIFYPLNNFENPLNTTNNKLINVSDDDNDDENTDNDSENNSNECDENTDDENTDDEDTDDEDTDDTDTDDETVTDKDTDNGTHEDVDELETNNYSDKYIQLDTHIDTINDTINIDEISVDNYLVEKNINIMDINELKILKLDEEASNNINNLDDKERINNLLLYEEPNNIIQTDLFEINNNELHDTNNELKTVNVNLEENKDNLDLKKLSINKLRNIAVDKGISSDVSKLKKNDILKLLGVE